MNLTIGHLYYDLLNLYGESGNIKALENALKNQNIKVKIKEMSKDDNINLKDVDILYIGSGTEQNRDIALNHLKNYKEELQNFINENKLIIATGNAYPLFGKTIIDADNKEVSALNIFDYKEDKTERIVKEVSAKTTLIKETIYAFENHYHKIESNNNWLDNEGYHNKNFYGTYAIGPILIRNPKLLNYILKNYLKEKDFKWKPFNQKLEEQAYQEFIKFKDTKLHIK